LFHGSSPHLRHPVATSFEAASAGYGFSQPISHKYNGWREYAHGICSGQLVLPLECISAILPPISCLFAFYSNMSATPFSEDTRSKLARCSTATLTTQLFKRGLRNVFIQGVTRLTQNCPPLVGEAYTLRNIPAREDLDHIGVFENPEHPQRKAIETIPPGHVLAIDCRGEKRVASGGSILMQRLQVRGAAGLVSDGALRDSFEIAQMQFPVYCAGAAAPLNLVYHHAIDINVPIACGGIAVYPGDIIVGDAEGVVVIPRYLAEEVANDAAEQELLEEFILSEIKQGKPLPGTYPPNEDTKVRYQNWKKTRVDRQ